MYAVQKSTQNSLQGSGAAQQIAVSHKNSAHDMDCDVLFPPDMAANKKRWIGRRIWLSRSSVGRFCLRVLGQVVRDV
jgi:hypothetical protein